MGRETESAEVLDSGGYAFRSLYVAININKIPPVRIAHGAPSRQAVVGRITPSRYVTMPQTHCRYTASWTLSVVEWLFPLTINNDLREDRIRLRSRDVFLSTVSSAYLWSP
jgi:hypothetical protein